MAENDVSHVKARSWGGSTSVFGQQVLTEKAMS